VTDRECHCQKSQTESQSHSEKTKPQSGESCGQDRAAATAKHQSECSNKFCT
jgi:hypothetical protein